MLFALSIPALVSLGSTPLVVTTPQGAVRGQYAASTRQVVQYKGIPFAQPPTGQGRFAPPRTPANWTGVRDASEFKHNCMQGAM